jgi:hypothetical protein
MISNRGGGVSSTTPNTTETKKVALKLPSRQHEKEVGSAPISDRFTDSNRGLSGLVRAFSPILDDTQTSAGRLSTRPGQNSGHLSVGRCRILLHLLDISITGHFSVLSNHGAKCRSHFTQPTLSDAIPRRAIRVCRPTYL